ncbi:hypothetical protein QR685DRAFT_441699 [Neurospora intermedia]|uniref:Uncharacterized protein n=1 Tax=Neurospora intermedia TaxID=5142 RepID=A0ABR3DCT8_NEUIN
MDSSTLQVTYPQSCCPVLLFGGGVKRTTRNASAASHVEMPGQLDLHQLHLQTILDEQTHAGLDRLRTL